MERSSGPTAASSIFAVRSGSLVLALVSVLIASLGGCGDDVLSVIDRSTGSALPSSGTNTGGGASAASGATTAGGAATGGGATAVGGAFTAGNASGGAATSGAASATGSTGEISPPSTGSFGPPKLIAALSDPDADDEDPTLSADGLELYFMSDRGNFSSQDIWVSTRATTADPWGQPTRVAELSTTQYAERSPSLSADGLTMWLASNRPPSTTSFDIWVSSRPSRTDPWTMPVIVPELSSTSNDFSPSVDANELLLFFTSSRPGGAGGMDIYVSTRAATAARWGTPEPVTELNTSDGEWDPFVSPDALTMFWAVWGVRNPQEQIVWATRPRLGAPFSNPVPLTELGTGSANPTLSPDLKYIVFVSTATGDHELYEARRP